MIIRWLIITVVFLAAGYFLPGIHVKSFWSATIAAIVLSGVNVVVKIPLMILTLPINLLTVGLFTFVINALMIWLVGAIVPGFAVDSFFWAFVLALIVSAVKFIIR